MVGRAVLAFGQATLPSPHLLSRQRVCHGSSVWPCGLTQLKQSRCSAYLWLAAPLLLPDYFSISTLAASAAGVPWFFGLALRPHSTRAIALLSLSVVGRTAVAFGLFCHLHTCCLGSGCAMVLQFGLAASLNSSNRVAQPICGWPHRYCFRTSYFAISTPAVSTAGVPLFYSLALRPHSAIGQFVGANVCQTSFEAALYTALWITLRRSPDPSRDTRASPTARVSLRRSSRGCFAWGAGRGLALCTLRTICRICQAGSSPGAS